MKFWSFGKILAVLLNGVMAGNIFFLVWNDKLASLLVFLLALVWLVRIPTTEKTLRTVVQIQIYGLFPFVYLLESISSFQSRIIVALLYLPVVGKLVPAAIDQARDEALDSALYTNLLYLYFSPVVLLQEVRLAYAILGGYALVYVFGWEKYLLRPIPLWERMVHVVGLSAILMITSLLL